MPCPCGRAHVDVSSLRTFAARLLGSLGASAGGKASKRVITPEQQTMMQECRRKSE